LVKAESNNDRPGVLDIALSWDLGLVFLRIRSRKEGDFED